LSSLADRIRGIVGTTHPVGSSVAQGFSPAFPDLKACAAGELEQILGGDWRQTDGCACFVVDRRWEPSARHGREAVGTFAECLDEASGEAVLFAGGAVARAPFVFFDLETTGLSGGAGTQAFLVGCAWFEADRAFRTRQFLLTRYADERTLLETVSGELARAGALVSFNGKSFDAPVLETRYLFHRLEWVGARLPHVDVLHPARRFWKQGTHDGAPAAQEIGGGESTCSLIALERQIVGAPRIGDVPGFEIPGRYFQFVRTGDARPLAAVLEHNRLDLLTLAALTARLLHLARTGPDAARDAREALALGHVYARGGFETRACDAFRRAVEMSDGGVASASGVLVKVDSLRALATGLRRARQYADAAARWRQLLAVPACPQPIAREATEALAIHHEHRERDLGAAKAFALRSLENGLRPAWTEAARHRLARIERKIEVTSRKSQVDGRVCEDTFDLRLSTRDLTGD
jgi:uncharacterized protein YprB with RNaseH-like and TPR domain